MNQIPATQVFVLGNRYLLYKKNNVYEIKDSKLKTIFDASVINQVLPNKFKLSVYSGNYDDDHYYTNNDLETKHNVETEIGSAIVRVCTHISHDHKDPMKSRINYKFCNDGLATLIHDANTDEFFLCFEESFKETIKILQCEKEYIEKYRLLNRHSGFNHGDGMFSYVEYSSTVSITKFRLETKLQNSHDKNGLLNSQKEICKLKTVKTMLVQTPKNFHIFSENYYSGYDGYSMDNFNFRISKTSNPKIVLLFTESSNSQVSNLRRLGETISARIGNFIAGNAVILNLMDMKCHEFPNYTKPYEKIGQDEVIFLFKNEGICFNSENDEKPNAKNSLVYDVENKKMFHEKAFYKMSIHSGFNIYEPLNSSDCANSYVYPISDNDYRVKASVKDFRVDQEDQEDQDEYSDEYSDEF